MFAGQLLAAAAAASALGTAQPNATLGIVGHSVLTGYAPDISQPHTDQGITGHSALTGYAPAVALANNAKIYGAVVGKNVTLSNNQTLVLTGFSQTTPAPLSCP